jgi:hypothetical protein
MDAAMTLGATVCRTHERQSGLPDPPPAIFTCVISG